MLITSTNSEKEVEKLLKKLLPDTIWANKIKSVGGYPRDKYLSEIKKDPFIEAKDLDLLVDNIKDGADKFTHFIHGKFKESISEPRQLGKGYPIWQITFKEDIEFEGDSYKTKGAVIEVADTMKESYPDPESRQRKTEPANLEDDIKRRDFTVNQLLQDLTTGEYEDLTGTSKKDIEEGRLRGHPQVDLNEVFNADPLRLIRCIRFNAKYNWKIPKSVLRSIQKNAERLKIVSPERIMEELIKIMKMGKLYRAVKLMNMTGILKVILPKVEALKHTEQNPEWHSEGNVFRHTLLVLKHAPAGVENQLAALLHDIGKPEVTKVIDGKIRALGHEDVGAEIAEAILRSWKFDNKVVEKVKKMVKNHMRPHDLTKGSTKAIRKFIRDVGEDVYKDILDLAHADALGRLPSESKIPDLIKKIEEIKNKIEIKQDAVLNGKEIMDLLDLKPGKEVGEVKKFLINLEDDYAEKNKKLTKEKAKEELLKKYNKKASICAYIQEISTVLGTL